MNENKKLIIAINFEKMIDFVNSLLRCWFPGDQIRAELDDKEPATRFNVVVTFGNAENPSGYVKSFEVRKLQTTASSSVLQSDISRSLGILDCAHEMREEIQQYHAEAEQGCKVTTGRLLGHYTGQKDTSEWFLKAIPMMGWVKRTRQ